MSINDVYHELRIKNGLTQQQMAKSLNIERSSLTKIENGSRKAPPELITKTAEQFDDPRMFLAAQEEITGGASVPWLDNADLHRAATHFKTIEEAEEALAAMKVTPIMKRPDQLSAEDREAIRVTIMECIEAITALTHHVAVLCRDYTFSWFGSWKEHRAELKSKKYLN